MWPPKRDLADSTLAAEQVVEDLYAEAIFRWAPSVVDAVLPTLDAKIITAAGDPLPPDPDGIATTQAGWADLVETLILPGVASLWTEAAMEAAKPVGAMTAAVSDIIGAVVGARDDFIAGYRRLAHGVPSVVRDELRRVLRDAPPGTPVSALRHLVREAVTPGSALLRQQAKRHSYHAAGVLNHALMTVAKHAGGVDKVWLSRRDERVREAHRIADGQRVPLGSAFTVGGVDMQFPGDPSAPPDLVFGCRCRLVVLAADETMPAWHSAGGYPQEPIAASASQETPVTVETEFNADTVPAADTGEQPIEVEPGDELEMFRTFTDAVFALIDVPTSDNRILHKDIVFDVRTPPLALTWMKTTGDGSGHDHAVTVGVIQSARIEDGKVLASGYLLNTPDADEAANLLAHGVTRPSVEFGRTSWHLSGEDGVEFTEADFWDLPLNAKVFTTYTEAELIATSLVATPAFGDTYLRLNEAPEPREPALVASVFTPRVFKAAHFADPKVDGKTYATLTDDCHVFGHIAWWDSVHRVLGEHPPHSPSDYAHFHTSPAVHLDDGTLLPVGRLTLVKEEHLPGHPHKDLDGGPAQAHYDNVGTCWALVRAGEDAYGIWFSGVVAPWATPETVEMGLSAPLSGDWRDFGRGLDLVAALSVNTPAFVARGHDDEQGRPLALVASLGPNPRARRQPQLTRADIKAAVAEALQDQIARQEFVVSRDVALARADAITHPKTPNEEIAALLESRSWVS